MYLWRNDGKEMSNRTLKVSLENWMSWWSVKGKIKIKDKRRLKMTQFQELIKRLFLLQEEMNTDDNSNKITHSGVEIHLMVIAFHVLTFDIWIKIVKIITSKIIKDIINWIKTIEAYILKASLQDHKIGFTMTLII